MGVGWFGGGKLCGGPLATQCREAGKSPRIIDNLQRNDRLAHRPAAIAIYYQNSMLFSDQEKNNQNCQHNNAQSGGTLPGHFGTLEHSQSCVDLHF